MAFETHKQFLLALAGASMLAAPAMAQTAAGQAAATKDNGAPAIGEIVVTANRVSSSAQKTSIALTVYSTKALATAGVHSVQALQTIDPSINVTSSTGAAYVAIRGIASTDVTEIGDPSVPIARDDFFTNRSYSIGSSLYDVERIEVLKGPQGTLFGRNSTGGLISIITQKPAKSFGGFVSAEGGDYDTINTEGALNAPLSDTVQLRFSGITRHHEGFRRLMVINGRGDDEDSQSGRAQIAFQPFAGFQGLFSYQHDNTDDVGDVAKNLPIGVVTPIGDPLSFPSYQPTRNRLIGDRERWEFSYNRLPFGLTLTYAGGYDEQDWKHQLDATGPTQSPLQQFLQHEHPATWNHEVRLATPQDQRFTAQVGYFHFEEQNAVHSGLLETSGGFAGSYLVRFDYDVKSTSDAVFGQVGYELIKNLRLTLGARYTQDSKTRTGQSVLDFDVVFGGHRPPFLPPQLNTPSNGDITESKPTYHAGLDWTPTASTLIYVKYDTGYKSGGFNSNGSAPSVNYGPENLKVVEIGTKNRFFDRHLQLNADAFYEDYTGYQASQTSSVLSGNGVFNVGSARIYGAELQAIALIDEVGRLDANATFLNTRFGDGIIVYDGQSTPQPHDIGGNKLPNAPDFVLSAGFEHDFETPVGKFTARIDGKYSSSFYYSVFNAPDTKSPSYATGNASLTYLPPDRHWELQAYIRNFSNETVLANAARNYVSGFNTYEFQPPRTFGARIKYQF